MKRLLKKIKLVAHKNMKRLQLGNQVGKPFCKGIMVYSKACNYARYKETCSVTIMLRAPKMA